MNPEATWEDGLTPVCGPTVHAPTARPGVMSSFASLSVGPESITFGPGSPAAPPLCVLDPIQEHTAKLVKMPGEFLAALCAESHGFDSRHHQSSGHGGRDQVGCSVTESRPAGPDTLDL